MRYCSGITRKMDCILIYLVLFLSILYLDKYELISISFLDQFSDLLESSALGEPLRFSVKQKLHSRIINTM